MDLVMELPPDIVIQQICRHLDYRSWVRAACLCRAWRDLFRQSPPPPNIPLMCLSYSVCNHCLVSMPSTFTSPFRHFPAPIKVGYREIGLTVASYGQYLLNIGHRVNPAPGTPRAIIIYNPFTDQSIQLPPLPRWTPFLKFGALYCLRSNQSRTSFVAAVSDVTESIHICYPSILTRWNSSSGRWAKIFNLTPSMDLIFHGGCFYSISVHRLIMAWDTNNLWNARRTVVPARQYTKMSRSIHDRAPHTFSYFLVESCFGELLVVTAYNFIHTRFRHPLFTVHRVDEVAKKLVRVHDLGNQMLFIGRGCSRSSWYGSHSSQTDFFCKNNIYFINKGEGSSRNSVGRFSLKDSRSWNSVVFHRKLLPRSYRPIWITPNPNEMLSSSRSF